MIEVILDNVSLYGEFGLILGELPIIPVIKERINPILIEGRNGTLTEKLGFEDRNITCNFAIENTREESIQAKIRRVTPFLINSKILKFSDDLGVYWKVKSIVIGDIARQLRYFGVFTLTFIVEPFSYLEDEIITIDKAMIIYNIGSYYSEPCLKIFGINDVNIIVNNKTIILKNIENYIEIDSELMQCRKDNVNTNNKMVGDFPILQLGKNNISWTGNINKIEIKPRWRLL